ncbi:hypothetical protein [Mycobacteroides abscessus]|uniref:hypothetical protein n=1 Tax=Mycobacteroides abscessus TaxID=36809 RepID=UPI000941182E|nr:hypothetical protein [Mycobacteroides abscessus]
MLMVSRDLADTLAERYPDAPETVEYHEQLRTHRRIHEDGSVTFDAAEFRSKGSRRRRWRAARRTRLRPAAAASAARRGVPT